MIKFKALVHKETGTVIKYEEWKEKLKKGERISVEKLFASPRGQEIYGYKIESVLYSDDFEIVYDSEFTTEELEKLYSYNEELDLEFKIKLKKILDKREFNRFNYGIEV